MTCPVTRTRYCGLMDAIAPLSDNSAALSDDDLVERVKHLVTCERRASVSLIRSLMEFDGRRLYLREGCSSLFTYCTQVLHLSEGSAYNRIEAARAAQRYPKVLEALERADLTLTAVRLLAPHLTPANHGEVLAASRHRSKQGIQELIASLNPRPAAATIIRRVAPQPSKGDSATTAAVTSPLPPGGQDVSATPAPQFSAAVVTPLAPERYKLQVTLSRETHEKLRRAQALARHAVFGFYVDGDWVPNGHPLANDYLGRPLATDYSGIYTLTLIAGDCTAEVPDVVKHCAGVPFRSRFLARKQQLHRHLWCRLIRFGFSSSGGLLLLLLQRRFRPGRKHRRRGPRRR